MKNLTLLLFLCLLFSCEENQDVTVIEEMTPDPILVTEMEVAGRVYAYPNEGNRFGFAGIHNASVKLVYDGDVFDETNTDGKGDYRFPLQNIPTGTYLLVEAPDYYPNARTVDASFPTTSFSLVPRYYGDFSGSGIHDNLEVVRITGSLQEDKENAGHFFYFVNENNELIGNYLADAILEFDITTVADTEIFLYHSSRADCPPVGPIPLGAFLENTYIGNVYEQNNDDFKDQHVFIYGEARTCDNMPLTHNDGYYLVKYGNTTVSNTGNGFTAQAADRLCYALQCELQSSPEIIITAVNVEESLFGEYTLTYSGEELIENIEIPTCMVDDTFFGFTVGGQQYLLNNFTSANITPDGRVVLKQISVSSSSTDGNASLELIGTGTPGTYNGRLTFYLGSSAGGVAVGAQSLTVDITVNDGEFMEGTISGEVYDAYEVSLGNVNGVFRARIQ